MTIRLLVDWKQYKAGNLATLDAGTETGLVAAKQADTNLAGGTPYTAPVPPESNDEARGLTGNFLTVGGGIFSTINSAISAAGSRYVARRDYLGVLAPVMSVTFTNGSPNVTTTGTFDIAAKAGSNGTPIGDFLAVSGRRYKIKYRTSSTALVLWENFVGTTGTYPVSYEMLVHKTVRILPGEYPETIDLVPGINVLGASREACVFSYDGAFGAGSIAGDNSISNVTIGPTSYFTSLDNIQMAAVVEYAGATFTMDNVLIRNVNEGNAHAGGGMHLSTIPGSTVRIKNSDIELGDEPFDLISAGDSTRRSRLEILNTNIRQVPGHQSGGVSGGFSVTALSDAFNATDYHDIYLSDVNIRFPDMLRNPSSSGTFGAILASGVNNTWELRNVTSDVTNTNASAASTERAGCIVVYGGVVRIKGCDLRAAGSNTAGAAGIALDVLGGTVYIENSTLEGNQFSIRNSGGTVYIGKGVTLIGPVSGTLSSLVRGVVTLNGATPVVVTTSRVHTASRIHFSRQVAAGTLGHFYKGAVVNNTSFEVVGQAGDTSVVLWELEE